MSSNGRHNPLKRILFLCVANSSRSQMAEGLARDILGPRVEVASAGSEPTQLNPLAVAAMKDIGIDISRHYSKAINDIDTRNFTAVCGSAIFPPAPGFTPGCWIPGPESGPTATQLSFVRT